MTGHSINAEQNQDFLSTMHTMIDDLDTISSNIDEHTYLRLANGLQRLYNIHIHNSRTSNNQNSANRQQEIGLQENNVAQNIIRHYERLNDISGVPINAYPVNASAYPVNSIINSTIANVNSTNANANVYVYAYDNVNYDSWNENNPAQNQESARISYTSLYANANDYWNQARFRQFQENIRAR